MKGDAILRAWVALLVLSALSTGLAALVPGLSGIGLLVVQALVLGAAWAKARLILADFLELRAAPRWRRGFGFVLALYMLLLLALTALAI